MLEKDSMHGNAEQKQGRETAGGIYPNVAACLCRRLSVAASAGFGMFRSLPCAKIAKGIQDISTLVYPGRVIRLGEKGGRIVDGR